MKRICRECGSPFQPRTLNQKDCSDDCRAARARRLLDERLANERRERQRARFAKIAAQATGVSNIHEAIKVGKSEAFEPADNAEPEPTDAIPGTQDKIELLRQRVEQGLPLWHPDDKSFLFAPGEFFGHRLPLPDPDELEKIAGDEW